MNLKPFLNNSMPLLETRTKNTHLALRYDLFCQKTCLIAIYASKFKQLANIILWGEVALIIQF